MDQATIEKYRMESGSLLKRKREERGLSIETVHESTKIPIDALKAIEEGYSVRTLTPFYYHGFLKMYARFLQVNIDEILENYKRASYLKPQPNQTPKETPHSFSQWITQRLTEQNKKRILVGIGVVVGLFLAFKILAMAAGAISEWNKNRKESKPKTETKSKAEKKEKAQEKQTAKSEPKTSVSAPVLVPASSSKGESAKGVSLTVRAQKSTWLRVLADDNIVFQSTLNSGASETWSAKNKIEISGKNLHLLDYELNGKLLGKLSRDGRQVKSVTITPDGLSVSN